MLCFYYCWNRRGMALKERVACVEGHPWYFLGFGALLSAATLFAESVWNSVFLVTVFFPLYVLLAEVSPRAEPAGGRARKRRVFFLAAKITSAATWLLISLVRDGAKKKQA